VLMVGSEVSIEIEKPYKKAENPHCLKELSCLQTPGSTVSFESMPGRNLASR
jgi:hypothetical protein